VTVVWVTCSCLLQAARSAIAVTPASSHYRAEAGSCKTILTPLVLLPLHCRRCYIAAAAGDNIVWTSYTVYEGVEAAFKHMRWVRSCQMPIQMQQSTTCTARRSVRKVNIRHIPMSWCKEEVRAYLSMQLFCKPLYSFGGLPCTTIRQLYANHSTAVVW
jgi:hypothetical protein